MTRKQRWARDAEVKRLKANPRKCPTYRDGFFDAIEVIRKELASRNGKFGDAVYNLDLERELRELSEPCAQVFDMVQFKIRRLTN